MIIRISNESLIENLREAKTFHTHFLIVYLAHLQKYIVSCSALLRVDKASKGLHFWLHKHLLIDPNQINHYRLKTSSMFV